MNIKLDDKKFSKLLRFLEENHAIPARYHQFTVSRICAGDRLATEKLMALFRSALLSNTGGGLATIGNAARIFAKKISVLPSRPTIKPGDLLSCFRVKSPNELFDALIDIDGVGKKKAALFLRDLWVTQNQATDCRIFSTDLITRNELLIPLDKVIAIGLNQAAKPCLFGDGSVISNAFSSVNNYFRTCTELHHMIIEDLWFWGYFGLVGSGYERSIEINGDKIALDPYFDLHGIPTKELQRFGAII